VLKVGILGAKGQLGRELVRVFGNAAIAYDRSHCDFRDTFHLRDDMLIHNKCAVVINATALNNVDLAEAKPASFIDINGASVMRLAHVCEDMNVPMIHFSTDYVFDGTAKFPYYEDAVTNPINNYGRSKLIGEMGIKMLHPRVSIIRTAGLYGKGGSKDKHGNFIDRIARKAQSGPVQVVVDQVTTPTYAKDLAEAVWQNLELFYSEGGVYHLTNEGECDWFRFAQEFIDPHKLIAVSADSLNLPAKRPKYSVLENSKLPKLRPWEDALHDYLKR